jgi:hypothetical protein
VVGLVGGVNSQDPSSPWPWTQEWRQARCCITLQTKGIGGETGEGSGLR